MWGGKYAFTQIHTQISISTKTEPWKDDKYAQMKAHQNLYCTIQKLLKNIQKQTNKNKNKQEQKQTSKQTRTKSLFIILGSNSWWLGAPKNWVSWGENINVNHKNHKMLINRKHGYWPQKITYKQLWLLAETHSYLSLSPTMQAQYCNICQNILHTICPLKTGVKDILTNITILS